MLHRLMLRSQQTTRTSSGDIRIAPLFTLLHYQWDVPCQFYSLKG